MSKLLYQTLLAVALFAACSPRKEKIPETPPMPVRSDKMVIYQMMTRLFANTNTTIVMAAGGAAVLNRINVSYYIGS